MKKNFLHLAIILFVAAFSSNASAQGSVLAVSIDYPKYIQTGSTISPAATFSNDGITTESFPVTMIITGGYSSTKNVTNLVAGDSVQVTFDPWTAGAVATIETAFVQTQLAGDINPYDDSLSVSIKVLEPFINYGWTSKAPIPEAKWGLASSAINSNDSSYLFALGGDNGVAPDYYTTGVTKYFPNSNSWSGVSSMAKATFRASGASFNNKVYVMGGFTLPYPAITDATQVYDAEEDTWSSGTPVPTASAAYALGVYRDSLFYLMGGYDGGFYQLDLVQIYNAADDTWTNGTNLPVTSGDFSGGIVGNKIVVSGGFDQSTGLPLAHTYVGDIDPAEPSNITWNAVEDYPGGINAGLGGGASLDVSSGLVLFRGLREQLIPPTFVGWYFCL